MVSIKIVLENNNSTVNKSINIWRHKDDIKNYFEENN